MSWINIKDYKFKEDTYMSVEKVDEAIPSLNQNNIKNFNFKFQNTVIDKMLESELQSNFIILKSAKECYVCHFDKCK